MCGILGYIGLSDKVQFYGALQTLSHRGPDGEGVWEDEGVRLGHKRLSIIDLSSAGAQPFHLHERYHMVFNGEVYNYLELRKELEQKGHSFRTSSDTEVVLAAFIEWGEACVLKFNGMWALAIWDGAKKELFLSRDRIGKKPLFYIQDQGRFAFASEMKALYTFLGEISPNTKLFTAAADDYFCYEHTESCLVNGVKRFPAGSNARLKGGAKLEINKYWEPLDHLMEVPKSYSAQCDLFRELFEDAVRIRLRSDVSVGTALSGGVDSGTVLAAVQKIGRETKGGKVDWQNAFTASFPGDVNDEFESANLMSNHLGMNLRKIEIEPLKYINDIYRNAYLFEEVYLTPFVPFVALYGEIKKNGITVSLDGHGADELFAGYAFDIRYAFADAIPSISNFLSMSNLTAKMDVRSNDLRQILRDLKFGISRKIQGKMNASLDHLNNRLFESAYSSVLPTLLRNYDRFSMMNGVEIRMPFLDHRLLSFAFSIGYQSKIHGGYSKSIVRDSMRDVVPPEIGYKKNKIGFNAPIVTWLSGELKTWVQDIISSQDFLTCDLIAGSAHKRVIQEIFKQQVMSDADACYIWNSIQPYVWNKSLSYANIK